MKNIDALEGTLVTSHIDILNVVLYVHKQREEIAADETITYVDYKDDMFRFYPEFPLSDVICHHSLVPKIQRPNIISRTTLITYIELCFLL